jgi:hypothetical protein
MVLIFVPPFSTASSRYSAARPFVVSCGINTRNAMQNTAVSTAETQMNQLETPVVTLCAP